MHTNTNDHPSTMIRSSEKINIISCLELLCINLKISGVILCDSFIFSHAASHEQNDLFGHYSVCMVEKTNVIGSIKFQNENMFETTLILDPLL